MVEEKKYCFGCMKPLAWDGKCTFCGFDRENYSGKKHHLPLGSTLNHGEYLVGRVLGEGGFGITYIGLHTTLQIPVAIKEYFPAGMVWRKCDDTKESWRVEPFTTEAEEIFHQGKTDFLREARVLSRFGTLDGIVRTRSFFEENDTAYLVMDYIEGDSVKAYVTANGSLRPELCWQILKEPVHALMKLHEEGLVHQDISPDNIIINFSGKGTLIDFGAVRHANAIDDKTRTAIYKQGFSAYEQLEKKGERGPWTDVYGLCATIYYMLTGRQPLDATERVFTDRLKPLEEFDLEVEPEVLQIIMRGLAVESSGRLQKLDELYEVLYHEKMIRPERSSGPAGSFRNHEEKLPEGKGVLTVKMERKLNRLDHRRRERKTLQWLVGMCCLLLVAGTAVYIKSQGYSRVLSGRGESTTAVLATKTPTGTLIPAQGLTPASEAAPTPEIVPVRTPDQTAKPAKIVKPAKTAKPAKAVKRASEKKTSATGKHSSDASGKKKENSASDSVRKTAVPVRHETVKTTRKPAVKPKKTAAPKQSTSNSSGKPKMDGSMTTDMDGDFNDYLSD